MPKPLIVRLTQNEIWHSVIQGGIRRLEAMRHGRRDKFQPGDPINGWSRDIEGAAAECAVAKGLHLFWSGISDVNASDVDGYQVRYSRGTDLVIRNGDTDSDRFVLVTGAIPEFAIHGWLIASEGKQPGYLKNPGGYGPAYFVPLEALHALEELQASYETF